jgi:hypothetical protein
VEVEQKKINADGTVGDFETVTEIRPTRWFDAFNGNSFVGLANDRDRVRIKLPESLLSMSTPPTIKFGVTGITGTSTSETSDNPDKISLPSGELMDVNLVTDANDDDGYSVLGPEDGDWDTTHLSSLSAKSKIEIHGLGAAPISVEVPVMAPRGKVEIVVRVLSETGALTQAERTDVMKDCLIAREIYSQLGIHVTAISISGMPLQPTISNLIADGDLSFTAGDTLDDESLLVETLPEVSGNKVPVYYIRSTIGFNQGGTKVVGLTTDRGPKQGIIVISLPNRNEGVLAHELAHAIGDDSHRPEDGHYPLGMKHLLMRNGGRRFDGNHLDAKRFTPEDERAITSNRKFYVPLR